jgi:hypothetical protein
VQARLPPASVSTSEQKGQRQRNAQACVDAQHFSPLSLGVGDLPQLPFRKVTAGRPAVTPYCSRYCRCCRRRNPRRYSARRVCPRAPRQASPQSPALAAN